MRKLWPLFLVLSLACAILNPYIGLFSLFLAVELLLYFCFMMMIRHWISLHTFSLAENNADNRAMALGRIIRILLTVVRVMSVVLLLLCTFVSCTVWLLASGRFLSLIPATDMAPFSLFAPEHKATASLILLAASVALNLLTTVTLFLRCNQLAAQLPSAPMAPQMPMTQQVPMAQQAPMAPQVPPAQPQAPMAQPAPMAPQMPMAQQAPPAQMPPANPGQGGPLSFKVNLPVLGALWAAAVLFGLLNTHVGWFSFQIHLCYVLYVAILKFMVYLNGKTVNNPTFIGTNARYTQSRLRRGQPLNRLFQVLIWASAGLAVWMQLLPTLMAGATASMVVNTGLNPLMLLLSCAANVALAWLLTASLRKIQ